MHIPVDRPHWSRFAVWWLWWVALCAGMCILAATSSSIGANAKAEARALLDRGVAKGEETKALTLLLQLETDYVPHAAERISPYAHWILWPLIGLTGACIALSFKPRAVFGIGKGEKTVENWRLHIRLISISVPTTIFGAFSVPTFRHSFTR